MRRSALWGLLGGLVLVLLCAAGRDAQGEEPGLIGARDHAFPGLDAQHEGKWRGPFFFAQLADTQFGMFEKDERWDQETALFTRAVERINQLKPRFVIVCGDLVNQVSGPQHAAQVREFQRIARQIDPSIPLVCVCGNHDVGNRPTGATLTTYRREWGDDWFSFQVGGTYGIVLNSNLYYDPTGAPEEYDRQHAWFQRELERAQTSGAKHLFVFQHHAWFLEKPEEPDQYFNIPKARREPVLELLRKAKVRAVFAGHYHRCAYGKDGELEMITSSAVGMPLGKDPSGFRLVKVFEDRIEHQYYGLDELPQSVKLD